MNKSTLALAMTSAMGICSGAVTSTAGAAAITGFTIGDVGSNTSGAGGYSSATDGVSGAFRFDSRYLNVKIYNGASFFSGDVGTGTVLGGTGGQATGSFSTGFVFSGQPFTPYIGSGGFLADITGSTLTVTTLDFGGQFAGVQDFYLSPDTNFPVEVLWVVPRGNDTEFDVAIRWGHDITSTEDPSLIASGFTAQWVLEGCMTTAASGTCDIDARPDISINVVGGTSQECVSTGGTAITFNALTIIPDDDAIESVTWLLDGQTVAIGESAEFFVPLGSHTVKVNLETVLGESNSDTQSIVVEDTAAPEITAAFKDSKTGEVITSIGKGDTADISISVVDTCDPDPTSSATTGIPSQDGDTVTTQKKGKEADVELSITGQADTAELSVRAEDTSGNMSFDKAVLSITP